MGRTIRRGTLTQGEALNNYGLPFLITDAVLVEIANGLARNYKREAVQIIEGFLTSEEVEVVRFTPELFAEAFQLYKTHQDKPWGLTDCISFIVMRKAGIQDALTFDRDFVQAGFRALMRDIGHRESSGP